MIRSLRRRHRWMVAALAIAALALYFAALAARPRPAVQDRLPEAGEPVEQMEAGD